MRENRETQPLPERPNRVAGRKGNPKGQALYERWPGVERLHSTCEVPEQRPGNLGAEGMEGRRLAKEIRRQGPDLDAKPEYECSIYFVTIPKSSCSRDSRGRIQSPEARRAFRHNNLSPTTGRTT